MENIEATMKENLRFVISDVREKINQNAYEKEEHIRLSLVARICHALGWNVWDPQEFNTEFYINNNDTKGLIDVALFSSTIGDSTPDVFIEVKYLGTITSRKYDKSLNQLEGYNRSKTAAFTVLTDGQYWLFFDSSGKGVLRQKHFLTINILSDDVKRTEKDFITFLSKTSYPDKAPQRARHTLSKIKQCSAIQAVKKIIPTFIQSYPDKTPYEIAYDYLVSKNQVIDVNTIKLYWDKDITPIVPIAKGKLINQVHTQQIKGKTKTRPVKQSTKETSKTQIKKLEDRYTGMDVGRVILSDIEYHPASWIEVKKIVYNSVLEQLKQIHLSKWYSISRSKVGFTKPVALQEGYFTEGNLRAYNVVKHCAMALAAVGLTFESDMTIEVIPKKSS